MRWLQHHVSAHVFYRKLLSSAPLIIDRISLTLPYCYKQLFYEII